MNYYLDTEFIENGNKPPIQLLSIGMVSDDGREFYAVVDKLDVDFSHVTPWINEHVIALIDYTNTMRLEEIKSALIEFMQPPVSIWGYYCDYDWVAFCGIFGKMIDLPDEFPKFCMDIKQLAVMLGNPTMPISRDLIEHHALGDARQIKFRHDWLMERMKCSCNGWGRKGNQINCGNRR